jgi:hypothetical protein
VRAFRLHVFVDRCFGGLTTLTKTIRGRPDEVKKVVRALKTDREIAFATYDVYVASLSIDGVPTREGMSIVRSR